MNTKEATALIDKLATAEPWHKLRYLKSWDWALTYFPKGSKILDVGGESVLTQVLRTEGYDVECTAQHDLRHPIPHQSQSFDGVVCTEVIEHMKDRETDARCTFTGSGIRNLVSELFRVTKPLGFMLLTTPNPCSIQAMYRMMRGEHPFHYELHVRELSPKDVQKYLTEAGWKIVLHESLRMWADSTPKLILDRQKSLVENFVFRNRITDKWLYGDCQFVITQR